MWLSEIWPLGWLALCSPTTGRVARPSQASVPLACYHLLARRGYHMTLVGLVPEEQVSFLKMSRHTVGTVLLLVSCRVCVCVCF